jgi:putative DNA-invertase from lambdoid prophage Rac
MIRAAIYLRVSTPDQQLATQRRILMEVAARRGWAVTEFAEVISGAARSRPQFDAMMTAVRRRKVDVVAAVDLSRLARSVPVLVGMLDELRVVGCDLYSDRESIDTSTASGRLLFTIIASVAAFERDILIERTMEGLATARAKGVRLGRPPASDGLAEAIRALRLQGLGVNSIARELRCGKSTVAKVIAAMEAPNAQS